MEYSYEQIAAIFKISMSMVVADHIVQPIEEKFLKEEMRKLGVGTDEKFREIQKSAFNMKGGAAFSIISELDAEGKSHVVDLLVGIMTSDGQIDGSERAMLQFVFDMCDLPHSDILK